MDPYSQYKKQLEYYEYYEKQKENFIDLSQGLEDPNNSVFELANILFNKSKRNLDQDLMGLFIDESMDVADIFCLLVELVLYGLDILSNGKNTIFSIEDSTDDIIYTIKSYLKSTGFDMIIHQEFIDIDNDNDTNLYRDRDDFFCEILPKPPSYLCAKGWYILNYRIINNKKFVFTKITPLNNFKAFFISNTNKIFTMNFKFANSKN
jgi:hypothetical protein